MEFPDGEWEWRRGIPFPSRLEGLGGSITALRQPKTETILVHFVPKKTAFSDRILVNVAQFSITQLLK